MVFKSRSDAGRCLAERLLSLPRWAECDSPRAVVGIPGGGVPVAYEVARCLGVPLDIVLARKITAPGNPELTIGAVGEDGVVVCTDAFLRRFAPEGPRLSELARETEAWLARRAQLLRGRHPIADVRGGDVVLVDDGMVTGATVRAAVGVLRHWGATGVVLAVPVASPQALDRLRPSVSEIVCLDTEDVRAIDAWYLHQQPITDTRITRLLEASRTAQDNRRTARGSSSPDQGRLV